MKIELKGLSSKQVGTLLPAGLIQLGWRGSIAHGMHVPSSDPNSIDDKDLMGVYVAPIDYYLGFGADAATLKIQTADGEWKDGPSVKERWCGPYDCVFYEVRKFVSLLLNSNPNVLSLLWLKDNGFIYQTPLGQMLTARRDLFVTKKAYHAFAGYADGQLRRMTHLNQEALTDLRNRRSALIAKGCGIAEDGNKLALPAGANDALIEELRQYEEIRGRYYKGYMGDKRRALVERFGYDCKNAAHLIRLLRMGIEFLSEGNLYVEREDKQELLAIKRGEWALEKVKAEAAHLFDLAREAYVRSTLPAEPDRKGAELLVMEIVQRHHGLTR